MLQAEIAAKLVAKAQCLARLAKADAGARLELQRSVSAAASSFHRDGTHQKSLSRTASVSQPHAASTSEDYLYCTPMCTTWYNMKIYRELVLHFAVKSSNKI